jgi:hypothetical protein
LTSQPYRQRTRPAGPTSSAAGPNVRGLLPVLSSPAARRPLCPLWTIGASLAVVGKCRHRSIPRQIHIRRSRSGSAARRPAIALRRWGNYIPTIHPLWTAQKENPTRICRWDRFPHCAAPGTRTPNPLIKRPRAVVSGHVVRGRWVPFLLAAPNLVCRWMSCGDGMSAAAERPRSNEGASITARMCQWVGHKMCPTH